MQLHHIFVDKTEVIEVQNVSHARQEIGRVLEKHTGGELTIEDYEERVHSHGVFYTWFPVTNYVRCFVLHAESI